MRAQAGTFGHTPGAEQAVGHMTATGRLRTCCSARCLNAPEVTGEKPVRAINAQNLHDLLYFQAEVISTFSVFAFYQL